MALTVFFHAIKLGILNARFKDEENLKQYGRASACARGIRKACLQAVVCFCDPAWGNIPDGALCLFLSLLSMCSA